MSRLASAAAKDWPHLNRLLPWCLKKSLGSTRCLSSAVNPIRIPPGNPIPSGGFLRPPPSSSASPFGNPHHYRGNNSGRFRPQSLGLSRTVHTSATDLVDSSDPSYTSRAEMPDNGVTDDMGVNVNISATQRLLELSEVKGRRASFYSSWLRHNCHCSECKQAHSGQILIPPHDLKPSYTITKAVIKDKNVNVWMQEDDPTHMTTIPLDFLWENDYSSEAREEHRRAVKPPVLKGSFPEVTYGELVAGPAGKLRWLEGLNKYGLSVIRGAPCVSGTVKNIAEMVYPVQQTIYPALFDVVSKPKPINVAYSSSHLGFHTDLVYYESPPGIQLLHCMRFDECVEGGDSVFIDSWAVAEDLREQYPEDFNNLTRIPATFQKIHFEREHPVYMRYRKPHIQCNDLGEIIALSWAPPFEGPLSVPEEDIEPYYKSYHRFAQMIEESDYKIETKLGPGDLVAFINTRVLHARNAFELNGGERHLQGCYLNIDEFRSEVEVMSRTVGSGAPSCRVGNHSYS